MKKVLLYLCMSALFVSQGALLSGSESDGMTKEEKKQVRRLKKSHKKDEKSVRKAEKKIKKSIKKEQRSSKKSMHKSDRKLLKSQKKSDKRAQKEEMRVEKKRVAQENAEMKKMAKEEKKAMRQESKKERGPSNREKCLERCRAGREAAALRQREKEQKRYENRLMRQEMMASWKAQRHEAVTHESLAGRYASQYKVPAWPVHARFSEQKYLMQVGAGYRYATDSYDNTGTNHDVTKNYFGSDSIRVKDVLLASKLVQSGTLTQEDFIGSTGKASLYLNYLADEQIKFNGRFEEYGTTFDLARYIKGRDFMIGIQIPFLYRKHHLKADLTPITAAALSKGEGLFGIDSFSGDSNDFLRRYGQDMNLFIKDILRSKGIHELGGSAAGLGDITLFVHGELTSAYFDRMVIGARALVPVAKEASQAKLWAPDLGKNGGLNEFAVFASTMLAHSRCINPHIFIEGFFSMPGHLSRRVPKLITSKPGATTEAVGSDREPNNPMTFANRVKYNNVAFAEFDTPLKNIGDHVASAKVTRGSGVELKVGNLFERFLGRQGSLDVYYQFKAKWKDRFSNLSEQDWNTEIFRLHSSSIQQNAGFEYNYQFDHDTRLSAGMVYTFSGMNTEKMFDVHVVMGSSF